MDTFFSYIWQALAVVFVLGGLIFIHELGHFIMARYLKIGVITFSLGFGPKILKYKKDKTTYCLSLIPLGGYVSCVGEYSDEVEELGFTEEDSIVNRKPLDRLLLAAAGPVANLVLAFAIYWGIAFSAGKAIALPTIGDIMPNSVAAQAGLQENDTIIRIGDIPIKEWNEVPKAIAKTNGEPTLIEYMRDGEIYTLTLTPKEDKRVNMFGEEEKAYLIGVMPSGKVEHQPLSFFASLKEGFSQTYFTIDMTLTGLGKLITGSVSADNVGGPILIAEVVGNQATKGIVPLLLLAALISVNLGLLNLLPIPVLDGGTIVFSLIEMLIRKPINQTVQEKLMQVGGVLLIGLMIFATFNDIMRFFK